METLFLQESQYDQWNEFVDRSPQGSIFAKTVYLKALAADYRILVAQNKHGVQGGIVLARDRWGYYINPVLCKYLGIFFNTFKGSSYTVESKRRDVQRSLLDEIRKLPSFDYTFHCEYRNWLPFYAEGFQQAIRITYRVDLSEAKDDAGLLDKMSARLRNKIIKARRENGHKIQLAEDFASVLPILENTYSRQKINMPVDQEHLLRLLGVLNQQDALRLTVSVDERGEASAVLGIFYDRQTAYLILNGVVDNLDERGVNESLIYEGITWARSRGLKYFDFEGSMSKPIESFYRQFGGEAVTYFAIWKGSKKRLLRRLKQKLF